MPRESIMIIGAGIGGLTLANALRRRGIEAKVFERAPQLAEVGAGIWVPSNAMQIMERLGLDAAVQENSLALQSIEVLTDEGVVLHGIDLVEVRKQYGHTTQSIHRARLQELLADAFGRERIHFGRECVGLEQDEQEVVVRFADGSEESGSLLVGADGIRSCVRGHLFEGIELRDSGTTCFRGIADLALEPEQRVVCREIWGTEQRFGYSALSPEQVYWFAPILQPFELSAQEARPKLLELFRTFPEPVQAIVEHTAAEGMIRTDLMDFAPISSWSKGRCVLIGDAAHATTPNLGQGAAQAIESAYILARALATHSSHSEAFAQYQAIRMDKAHHITETSWRFGKAAHMEEGVLRNMRDWAMKNTPHFIAHRQTSRIYDLGY